MKYNIEPLRRWLGFSRRERSSALILLLIILLLFALRYMIPDKSKDIVELSSGFYNIEDYNATDSPGLASRTKQFSFDPNTATFDTLIMVGLASKQANILINYRNKGGRFRKPSDIKKIYGLNEEEANALMPLIKFRPDTTRQSLKLSDSIQKPLIEINSCDSAALVTLPGIGPVLSARIIKFRHLLGGFASITQLQEVYGLPEETYRLIRDAIYIDTLALSRININSADYKEIARLPYLEKYEVTAILKYRELNGNITDISDLTRNSILTSEKAHKVRPYLEFR